MTDDEREIRALIRAQFDSIGWDGDRDADWLQFHRGFVPGAQMFPARRPAEPQKPLQFANRLDKLRGDGALDSFSEKGVGFAVRIVGSVAVALAGCEMTENGETVTRDVSAFLLVKNPGGWLIAAQAWDLVDDIPAAFAAAGLPGDS